jgi:hypothetical protein
MPTIVLTDIGAFGQAGDSLAVSSYRFSVLIGI